MTNNEVVTATHDGREYIYYHQDNKLKMLCSYEDNIMQEFQLFYTEDIAYEESYNRKGELIYKGVYDNKLDHSIKLMYTRFEDKPYHYFL